MTIEIKEGNTYVGVWFAKLYDENYQTGDVMAALYKEESQWHLKYRFRYYKDDKFHNSEDIKHWYEIVSKDDSDEKKEEMVKIFNQVLTMGGIAGALRDVLWIPCKTGHYQEFVDILSNPERDFLHRKELTAEESREFERTGQVPD